MHTDSEMTGISHSGSMHYMTAASLEMSDEPKKSAPEGFKKRSPPVLPMLFPVLAHASAFQKIQHWGGIWKKPSGKMVFGRSRPANSQSYCRKWGVIGAKCPIKRASDRRKSEFHWMEKRL